jgi:hypothetical protein
MEEKPKFIPKTPAAMHESAIQRSLAALDDALKRCRTEDVRYAMAIARHYLSLSASRSTSGRSSGSGRRSRISTPTR